MDKKYALYRSMGKRFDTPLVIDGITIKNTDMAILSEGNKLDRLGAGFFRMVNAEDSFEITFPTDEVILVLKGICNIKVDDELIKLEKGDVFYVRKGLTAAISSDGDLEYLFVNLPH